METIYKGSGWEIYINLEAAVVSACLYSKATKQSMELRLNGSSDNSHNFMLSGNETAELGVGMYDLEIYAYDSIVDVKNNFVKVVETSKSN